MDDTKESATCRPYIATSVTSTPTDVEPKLKSFQKSTDIPALSPYPTRITISRISGATPRAISTGTGRDRLIHQIANYEQALSRVFDFFIHSTGYWLDMGRVGDPRGRGKNVWHCHKKLSILINTLHNYLFLAENISQFYYLPL